MVAGSVLLVILVASGFFGPVPSEEDLRQIQHQEATRIFSSDGVQLGTYHLQNRTTVSLDEISPELLDALLAIEDIRFYDHNGIDRRALGRVLVRTILLRQNAGGGSTITQQLAKNLYPREHNGGFFIVTEKIREMIVARKLEEIYSKEEILELYLNTVSFGEDTFGIEMASYRFFNKPPSELTLPESATLAGLLRATTFYNPHRNPERSQTRRNLVIRQMERYEMISEEEAGEAIGQPLMTDYNRTALSDGMAPYFREHIRRELHGILREHSSGDKEYNLYTDGLTIHTTLDSRMQSAAEEAVALQMKQLQQIFDREQERYTIFGEDDPDVLRVWNRSEEYRQLKAAGTSDEEIHEILHTPVPTRVYTWDGYEQREISPYDEIRYYLKFLNAGLIAMHPETGHVLAWVGGIEHRHFPFDQIRALRQPGSAFKPILYAAALEHGRRPCDYQRNYLATYASYDDWTPRNIEDEYGGRYSLQAALAQSVNTVAVHLAMETGIPAIRSTASSLGIHSPMPDAPSIALGTAGVSLLELTTSYTAFLNSGIPAEPQFITRIYDADGNLIYPSGTNDIGSSDRNIELPGRVSDILSSGSGDDQNGISGETAAAMVSMLQKAVDEGTGQSLRTRFDIHHAVAGKTGTTQNFTDGWFIGFTPDLVFGVRVGGANNRVRFRDFPAYASQTALPLAGHFLSGLSNQPDVEAQPASFHPDQTESGFAMQCEDFRDDRVRDRVRDFFTGRSSDEPRVIEKVEEDEEESRNVFRRLGRRLGISGN